MHLGETIATYDLGLALRGKSGEFEVISPAGEIYHVICRPNHSISNLQWAGSRTNPLPFMVRKVTETVSLESGKETATQTGTGRTPFLLESEPDDGEPLFAAVAMIPKAEAEEPARPGAAGFDLVCLESDPETGLPAAWIAARGARGSRAADEMSITARCVTFNELDAEIRKLHAQLEEIRARAKKKFYTAYAAATA
jgi:hypothetical protein